MPAKRKLLPRPCPMCSSSYGTIQTVYFPGGKDEFLFRIGHYVPEKYTEVKQENENPYNYASDEEKEKKLKLSERLWCSFRSEHLEFDNLFDGNLDLMLLYSEETKPVTKQMSNALWIKVVNEGWKVKHPKILSPT